MKPVNIIEGRAVPLERSDVDTDQIIPSDWLKRVERTGFGKGLFSEWRDSPDFVLNKDVYAGANILVAGPRFGTGSSREHAVWALMDYGFEAIVSSSFGDIFRNNSSKQGLVIVQLTPDDVDELMELVKQGPDQLVVIDVDHMKIEVPEAGWSRSFALDAMTRERLLNGWDDIGLTLRREAAITSYETTSHAPTLVGVFDEHGHPTRA
jgi:3-isopropylmalate/(R)-2-methylmalate dehydratase small subunit